MQILRQPTRHIPDKLQLPIQSSLCVTISHLEKHDGSYSCWLAAVVFESCGTPLCNENCCCRDGDHRHRGRTRRDLRVTTGASYSHLRTFNLLFSAYAVVWKVGLCLIRCSTPPDRACHPGIMHKVKVTSQLRRLPKTIEGLREALTGV